MHKLQMRKDINAYQISDKSKYLSMFIYVQKRWEETYK
jgi:hypothetical protein